MWREGVVKNSAVPHPRKNLTPYRFTTYDDSTQFAGSGIR